MKSSLLICAVASATAFAPASSRNARRPTSLHDVMLGTRPEQQGGSSKSKTLLQRLDRFLTRLQRPEDQHKDYVYLNGNYAPVSEEKSNVPVEIIWGELPPLLDGMFVRNGPNPDLNLRERKKYHWFDGAGMLHFLRIKDGRAVYSNQFVPSVMYNIEKELGEEYFVRLGEYKGITGLIKAIIGPDLIRQKVPNLMTVAPPNTNCLMYKNKFYCLNEANLPFECRITPDGKLEPVGYETFGGALDFPVSAHPRIDHNGDLLFHSYSANADLIREHGIMKVGRYCATAGDVVSYFVPIEEKEYVSFAHSLVFTENYSIIWDCSVHFDSAAMFDGGSYFRTKSQHNLRFGVIPKSATATEEAIWIDTGGPGGIVHPLNSWEDEDGTIVIWTPFCEHLDLNLDTEEINKFLMTEFRLDPNAGTLIGTRVIDHDMNVEFSVVPTMGRKIKYGYTAIQCESTPGEGSFAGFCIWDVVREKVHRAIYYKDGEVGGEPMVLKDDSSGSVYVGVYTYNLSEGQSCFLLFEGESGDLVVRLKMPHRVPFGFHGIWVGGGELRDHFAHHAKKKSMDDGLPHL